MLLGNRLQDHKKSVQQFHAIRSETVEKPRFFDNLKGAAIDCSFFMPFGVFGFTFERSSRTSAA